ncbi:MAG TPA: LLM class F420-dependent oxidoreductase [Acidimicrobiia bacterium]|nr:LLM class F420-dependent oxidoreductase [Acidimicrobiia bacterium]
MRVGLFLPSLSPLATPEFLIAYAEAAEQSGFASIWLGEHVVFLDDYASSYPYSADGRLGLPSDVGLLELFGTLTYLAAVTDRIRLGTAVCLVPQRNPVYTAKSVATADWLSGGRVDFGVGIGWLREEFAVLDMPFEQRAAVNAEYLAVMRSCWQDEVSSYEGRHYTLPPCRMYPKPVQQPHPPIYFGGETDAALRRVARHGDGWHGFNHLPDSAAASVRRLEGFLADEGRSLADVDVTVGAYLQPVQPTHLAAYRDAGVDQLVLSAFAADPDGIRTVLGTLGDEYVDAAARL